MIPRGATALLALLLLSSCLLRSEIGAQDPASSQPPPRNWSGTPLDLLFVIDNSGSMAEEQQRLAQAFRSLEGPEGLCDRDHYVQLRSYLKEHPGLALSEWEDPYPAIIHSCGLREVFELFQVRFQIGVITTDFSNCDVPYGSAGRGSVPQRGCLQTGTRWPGEPVLTWQQEDPIARFQDLIDNLGIYGSAYEKGLQAAVHFLTPGHATPPAGTCALSRDCRNDLELFWRDQDLDSSGVTREVPLLVVFLSDEDDCSHTGSLDESVPGNTALCYEHPELLEPSSTYASALTALKSDPSMVHLGLIGGVSADGQAAGCTLEGQRVRHDCDPAQGNSVATCTMCVQGEPVCACHAAIEASSCEGNAYPATDCCQSEPTGRYLSAVRAAPRNSAQCLCEPDYRPVLNRILLETVGDLL